MPCAPWSGPRCNTRCRITTAARQQHSDRQSSRHLLLRCSSAPAGSRPSAYTRTPWPTTGSRSWSSRTASTRRRREDLEPPLHNYKRSPPALSQRPYMERAPRPGRERSLPRTRSPRCCSRRRTTTTSSCVLTPGFTLPTLSPLLPNGGDSTYDESGTSSEEDG